MVFQMIALYMGLFLHPIHVSVCDVTQKNDAVELTFKIFFDDLQTAMGLIPGEELPEKYSGADALIKDFILKHFKIKVNGKPAELHYKESYKAMPAIWTEMTISNIRASELKTLEIDNGIMVDLFKDQTNIVNVNLKNQKKNFALNTKSTQAKMDF